MGMGVHALTCGRAIAGRRGGFRYVSCFRFLLSYIAASCLQLNNIFEPIVLFLAVLEVRGIINGRGAKTL